MEPFQKTFGIMLLGALGLGGIIWQWHVIKRGKKGLLRVKWAGILSVVLILGVVLRGLIAWHFDDNVKYKLDTLLSEVGATLIFCSLFVIKSYFGPILVAASAALLGYYFMEYGEIGWFPVLASVVEWVVSFAPAAIQNFYIAFFGVYAFGTSIADTVDLKI